MNKVTVHKQGEFQYEPSVLELFVEETAQRWDRVLTDLVPFAGNFMSANRRSTIPETCKDHDLYFDMVRDGNKFDEAERYLCDSGRLTYERRLYSTSHMGEMRWEKFSERQLLEEIYGESYPSEENAQIWKDGKTVKVNFKPDRGYTLEVYNFDMHNAIPEHKVRCCIHTSVKHNLWMPVHFDYYMFEELAGEKTAQQIAEEDTFSTLRNYLGLNQDVK